MLIVAGTPRSGTSLWMQILHRANYPIIGDKFPSWWENSIKNFNPHGFWESKFRYGINWTTNPVDNVYFSAEELQHFAIKIFLGCVAATERAYIDRVIWSLRHWSSVTSSFSALREKDKAYANSLPVVHEEIAFRKNAEYKQKNIEPEIEWFLQVMYFLRDMNLRKYPVLISPYETLIQEPERELRKACEWLEIPYSPTLCETVDLNLHRHVIDKNRNYQHADVFNDLYDALCVGTISSPLMKKIDSLAQHYHQLVHGPYK